MSKTREKCTIDKRETVGEKGGYATLWIKEGMKKKKKKKSIDAEEQIVKNASKWKLNQ